ncbi:MAG: hypothetical protein MUF50_03855 [Planctomycetes bacterium]|jgi:ubiquinone/menaquinone biosynthesis C-methylase UbiE|nr:hypothetical protein [Planctomycetota bacterium]
MATAVIKEKEKTQSWRLLDSSDPLVEQSGLLPEILAEKQNFYIQSFRLLALAIPHYEEMQNIVATTIDNFFRFYYAKKIAIVLIGARAEKIIAKILATDSRIFLTVVDDDPVFLTLAKAQFKNFPEKERIEFIKEDPFLFLKKQKKHSINSVVSVYSLHGFQYSKRFQITKHAFRILRQGGLFISADKYGHDSAGLNQFYLQKRFRQIIETSSIFTMQTSKELNDEWKRHYYSDSNNKVGEESQLASLKKIGFPNVESIFRKEMEAIIMAWKDIRKSYK